MGPLPGQAQSRQACVVSAFHGISGADPSSIFHFIFRRYKKSQFAADVLHLLRDELHVPSWHSPYLEPSGVKIFKVSGSLTNAVFFVSYPTASGVGPRTLLLRIYGPSSCSHLSSSRASNTPYALFRVQDRSTCFWHVWERASRGIL